MRLPRIDGHEVGPDKELVRTSSFLILALIGAHFCFSAESHFPEISKEALGDKSHVFEFVNNEAIVGQQHLKRVEISRDSVVFTVRNESAKDIEPRIAAIFFNRYGMRLCKVECSFESSPVKPEGVGVKQASLTYPSLEEVFDGATLKLPVDWKQILFVKLDVTTKKTPDESNERSVTGAKKPPERQVLQRQQVRPGIFSDNKFGTANIGPTAMDAKWSNYGVYVQRMIETVQIQWDRILLSNTFYPPQGTTVTVKFRMDSEGKITSIVDVKNTSNDQGKEACISAIKARSPYGKWSDDMIAVLGESQDITFTFYYQ
jgi:hypothetical protein